jgi:putative ABC transport system substrate-binding protein
MIRVGRAVGIACLVAGPLIPLVADAQPAARTARVGWLGAGGNEGSPVFLNQLREGLREHGYVEGRNLVIESRLAGGKLERLPALAAELVAQKVDVIVAVGTVAALPAKQATSTTPIVFAASDPVASGLVPNLPRPGDNLTGVSTLGPDVIGKSLEMLKQAVPGVGAVAILWNPGTSGEDMERNMLAGAKAAGLALNLRLQFVEVRSPDEFDRAFAEMTKSRVGALAVLPGTLIPVHRRRVVDLAARHRLPALYISMREIVDAGGLMSYGANSADLVRRIAVYVDKILKGSRPGDLPVEQPTKLDLVINLKAARTIGLTVPPSVRARADQVIDP